ncbi:MAG: toll/interleukin-1 receptor domain-containing protein, partial [Anaerolineae bacterium]|nr:toll/interleukin-1 receptor domain-containing protein [Anaerolineae bacterium]
MSHVFISYSKKDIRFARYLKGLLEDAGFPVWMDEAEISPSAVWSRTIEENVLGCDAFVVIMSKNSKESEWVEREVLLAEREDKPIFPVLLSGEVWFRLANIQYIDMRNSLREALPPLLQESLSDVFAGKEHSLRSMPRDGTSFPKAKRGNRRLPVIAVAVGVVLLAGIAVALLLLNSSSGVAVDAYLV